MQRNPRIEALKIFAASAVCLAALIGIGMWYRATIPDWDDCIRNNKCFVCHKPAYANKDMYKGFGKNVRLCEEHSTGTQAWRWVVYGVPAIMVIYQDAPMGSGGFMQPLIRGALILFWFIGLLIFGAGIIYGISQVISAKNSDSG
jgi:hypothetical protein